MKMSFNERKLLSFLLKDSSGRYSNHVCNDLSVEMKNCLTEQEWKELDTKVSSWNGADVGDIMTDWLLMDYFADVLVSKDDEKIAN